MEIKKYTYKDWLNGVVVLEYSRRQFNSNEVPTPTIVSWENFEKEEKETIQKEQKIIFENSKDELFKKLSIDFFCKFQRTRSKFDMINRLLKRFSEVFSNRMICHDHHCYSSDRIITFDFWYYQEMITYIDFYFIGGEHYDFSNVQSPNCIYHNHTIVMPEIMVDVYGLMNVLLKKERIKLKNPVAEHSMEGVENDINDTEGNVVENPYPDIFATVEAYDFFCQLEKLSVIEKEYVAGYSFIYHKMKDDRLKYPIKKNVRASEFCDFLKDERGQQEIYPPKLKKRECKKNQLIFEDCKNNYLIVLTKKSPK